MTTRGAGFAAAIALSGFVHACGSASDSGFAGASREPGAADGGAGSPASPQPNSAVPVPTDNAVILVHAAKSPSFRLCFKSELDRRPQPDSQVMPQANVVGVEVGSTVRIGPLRGAPGEIFLFDEPLIRAFYPQFGGNVGPTCGDLLSASNPLSKIAVSLGTVDADFSHGVHLLVVRGCPGNGPVQKFTTAECGPNWNAVTGNLGVGALELTGAIRAADGKLPVQVVNLSQPLEGARAGRSVVVSFGDLARPAAPLEEIAKRPPLFGGATPSMPVQVTYAAADQAVYATSGFRVRLLPEDGGPAVTLIDQTLEAIQSLSSPRDLPPSYYAAASNYALLLLGDPGAKLGDGGVDPDGLRKLHFLAIPVVKANTNDAGPDSGAPTDGGAAR